MVCGEDLRTRLVISRATRFKKNLICICYFFLNSKHISIPIQAHLQIFFYGLEFSSLDIRFIELNTTLIIIFYIIIKHYGSRGATF
ncbi:hypothetical protein HanIR_Chr17g0893561 [Helianthus annuus]|nr:hypothetical protein HanIR_Chr17g0893561 [Helianthus annuus]